MASPRLAIVVKGFPRLSETFIARELEALEQRGLDFELHALRNPGADANLTAYTVKARCRYLPEYLHDDAGLVMRSVVAASSLPGFGEALSLFASHLRKDLSRARVRRFGQACVLATRLGPGIRHIHSHFAHSPTSVARYAAVIHRISFSISAHAKDVWTDDEWDLKEKLQAARFVAICNQAGESRLASLMPQARLHLIHHGIAPELISAGARAQSRDGTADNDPVRLICIARAVEKKGLATLLRALALLPRDLHVRLDHHGDGELLGTLRQLSDTLGLGDRVRFHGPSTHADAMAALDDSDLFVLPASVARSGDRDGIPNALLEAKARGIAVIAGDAGGTSEAVKDRQTGRLVPADAPDVLAKAIEELARNPALRMQFASAGLSNDVSLLNASPGHDEMAGLLRQAMGDT